jgi:hypothetical protein
MDQAERIPYGQLQNVKDHPGWLAASPAALYGS